MQTGALTGYMDVAQVALYAFWFFFAGLLIYLRQEDKREGYPLENDGVRSSSTEGFPPIPTPKVWILQHGTWDATRTERDVAARPTGNWPGAPLQPTGNPMVDGVGPASYALRGDEPDLGFDDGKPKIVPLRVARDFFVATEDVNPIGLPVVGADGIPAGRITDVWVDRSEVVIRFLEAEITVGTPRHILIPMNLLQISSGKADHMQVRVKALLTRQFADIPALRNPDQITLLEEDRIMAYFGGGHMYAEPQRLGPVL